jgi:hypothetical protein
MSEYLAVLHDMTYLQTSRLLFCSARLVGELPLRPFALVLGLHAEGGRGSRKKAAEIWTLRHKCDRGGVGWRTSCHESSHRRAAVYPLAMSGNCRNALELF